MKPYHWIFLLVALAAAPLLSAQQANQIISAVNVPFEFVVNDTVLPAGTYAVQSDPQNNLLVFVHATTQQRAMVFTSSYELKGIADKSALTFRKDGNTYVLHQVQRVGDNHTHDVVHGRDVIELAENR
jgi:hypothetical protein